MSIIIHDSTGLISGALKTIIPPNTAWTNGREIDLDRIRRFVADQADYADLVFDLEKPNLMALNALAYPLDRVKRGVEVGISILEVAKAERSDMRFAWYDSLIEDETIITNAYESMARRTAPVNDGEDAYFARLDHLANLGRLQWANDQLADLHAAEDFGCRRCYFGVGADAWKRSHIIHWAKSEGDRIGNGRQQMALYKPNRQTGNQRVEHTDADIAADVEAMRSARWRRICLWRDQITPADRIVGVVAATKVEMQK